MFNSITGTITGKFPRQLFLENNGIEWDLVVPDSNLELLPPVGEKTKVYTWIQHTENAMAIFGFSSAQERSLFFDLLKVDGVGPKGAVKIMSSATSDELTQTLESGDVGLLEKIPGIGKKTAGKMMLALKGKLSLQQDSKTITITKQTAFADVVNSLVSMGYDRRQVEQKIAEISAKEEQQLNGKSQKEKEDIVFRKAIVELA